MTEFKIAPLFTGKFNMHSLTIKGFLETSLLDWWGKLAAVLFLPDCNFRCPYCHNPELVLHPQTLPDIPLEYVLERLAKFKGWLDGVVITGGEPTLHSDLPLLMRRIKHAGWPIKLDTNGSQPDMLKQLLDEGLVDYVAMDVKAPLNELDYQRATGRGIKLEDIKESMRLLKAAEVEYELRTTLCPGLINKEKLTQLFGQLKGTKRLVLQNFKPSRPIDSNLQHMAPYPVEYLNEISRIGQDYVQELRMVG
jgi:pyruvate formate lyase activating enzyme